MALFELLGIFGAVFGLSIVSLVVAFWIAGKITRVPNLTWRNAVKAALVLNGLNLMLVPAAFAAAAHIESSTHFKTLLIAGIFISLNIWILLFGITWSFRIGVGRAAIMGALTIGLHTGAAFCWASALRVTWFETFVIPTGSMAPGVYGLHQDVKCPNCGRQFAVGDTRWLDVATPAAAGRMPKLTAVCLNCGEQIQIDAESRAQSGDRILVQKNIPVARWDRVVHFKHRGAVYLSRLVGLPGEKLDFSGGDLFVDKRRVQKPLRDLTDLWLPVFDSRYVPRQRADESPDWRPERETSRWTRVPSGGWRCVPGEAQDSLIFRGSITDVYQYNANGGEWAAPDEKIYVGDVRIVCEVAADADWQFIWKFNGRSVRFSVSPTEIGLSGGDEDAPVSVHKEIAKPSAGVPREFQFAVRDGIAYVATSDVELSAPIDSGALPLVRPAAPAESCRLEVSGGDGSLTVARLRIDRDVYYFDSAETERIFSTDPGELWFQRLAGGLGPEDYFFLGDNVRRSKDCRFDGPCLKKDLIGLAGACYWPPARARRFPPSATRP